MKDSRSSSQILFGFLPTQTVDLQGGIWKVKEWKTPRVLAAVDIEALAKEVRKSAAAWRASGKDSNLVSNLERGYSIRAFGLDRLNGVSTEPFPKIWYCKRCRRISKKRLGRCKCGLDGVRSQLHFAAYHDACGALREPRITFCPSHQEAIINFPGTSTAREISFSCSQCGWSQRGFPITSCDCGKGPLEINVHRAASVFTPRGIVLVNPPRREVAEKILSHDGRTRALRWVLNEMEGRLEQTGKPSAAGLKAQLEAQGMSSVLIEAMINAARSTGELNEQEDDLSGIVGESRIDAEDQAISMALAASSGRKTIKALIAGSDPDSELVKLYSSDYSTAMKRSGIRCVELLEKFPIFTGHFGYTRGDPTPGQSCLVPYEDPRSGYTIYGDLAETEALLFRLSASRVVQWLSRCGFIVEPCSSEREASEFLLRSMRLPSSGEMTEERGIGAAVLGLLHSYCHRIIRILAVHAGIERSALSEYLVPMHLGFYVYAAARGDFVMGGLQAVFESELHRLLKDMIYLEHRCALDPGCATSGGACMSCLHLGEPSCRYWNMHLSREYLFGREGYLSRIGAPVKGTPVF